MASLPERAFSLSLHEAERASEDNVSSPWKELHQLPWTPAHIHEPISSCQEAGLLPPCIQEMPCFECNEDALA